MKSTGSLRSRLPLFVWMLAFGLACILAALIVNSAVIFALPRPQPELYQLGDIELVLGGRDVPAAAKRVLSVRTQSAPPDAPPIQPGGFRERAVQRLAHDLGVSTQDVVYTRPPPPNGLFEYGLFKRRFGPRVVVRYREPSRLFDLEGRGQPVMIGPFTAALRQSDGRWRVVEAHSPRLLDPWRQHALLWFLASVLVTAPLAYLFARRVSAPFAAFAAAAERLGRDPGAPPLELRGSAEIRVAAKAFNEMQERLRRYVDDRTQMIGAVAHDLRTPLTRLRFHAEAAPAELRRKLAADIAEMDAMVAATLAFVKDATQAGPRARVELSALLESVAGDFTELGRDVRMQHSEQVVIRGDSLALRRLFANLIDNAVKFGGLARVRLQEHEGAAIVEVEDDGPGLPDEELESVFEAFRRAEPSRSRDTGGIGLGLTVSRSIARAHGGDIVLANRRGGGLCASVSLPI